MKLETAYLGGGCFWGMEELVRHQRGVQKTEVGYMGGNTPNATYDLVKRGQSNHAETLKVEFDSSVLSFEDLLVYFFTIHDPTTPNQQGNDRGTQYRSVIFTTSDEQALTARKVIERVEKSGAWKRPLVTEVIPAPQFWSAEEEHQNYLQKYPSGYTCHYERKVQF